MRLSKHYIVLILMGSILSYSANATNYKYYYLNKKNYLQGNSKLSSDDKKRHHYKNRKTVSWTVSGIPVTGSNRRFGKPIWDLGESLGTLGYNFIYEYNPGQAQPMPITSSTSHKAILASGTDSDYLALFGQTTNDISPSIVNIPVHQMPVLSGPSGETSQLPSVFEVGATGRTRVATNKPVTLSKWLNAKAKARFKCFSNGAANVSIRFKSLIPDAIYSIWGVFSFDTDGDGSGDAIGGVPLGGVPNLIVSDSYGYGTISRKLNFCPKDEPSLKYLTAAFHSDVNNNGAVPDQALLGLPGGTIAHAAISFPINAVRIK